MRRLIRSILMDKPLGDFSTIEDDSAIEELTRTVHQPSKLA